MIYRRILNIVFLRVYVSGVILSAALTIKVDIVFLFSLKRSCIPLSIILPFLIAQGICAAPTVTRQMIFSGIC